MRQRIHRMLVVAALAACAVALAPAGSADDAATPGPSQELIAKLADADAVTGAMERGVAADELVKRGATVVPELVAALADPRLRVGVAGVIERLGPVAKDAVPALVGIAKGGASPARVAAVRALGAVGADALPGLSALTTIVSSTKAKDRGAAAAAIERILVAVARAMPRTAAATDVDRAIAAGCEWLVRHQSKEGAFDCDGFAAACVGATKCSGPGDSAYDVGVTGLATLALLGETFPPAAGRKGAIDAALAYLASTQTEDGHFGPQMSMHHNYNHACAALAVADAVARTGRADLRASMEGGVRYVVASHNPYLAWRYGRADGDNDTSVTVWMMKALQRAADAGVPMDSSCREGALAWLDKMTEPEKGRTGYQQRGGPPARTSEMQGSFPASESESLTACALVVRLAAGQTRESDTAVAQGLALLAGRRPAWSARGSSVDLYYWMHASEAVRLAGGNDYTGWRRELFASLLPHQVTSKTSCNAGSWPPDDPWSVEGGRVYATAAALLALEACAEDPASRPPLPLGAKAAIDALTKAAADADPALAAVAARAAARARSAFRP